MTMDLLKLLAVCLLSLWVIISTHHRIQRADLKRSWRRWFWSLVVVGVGLGVWLLSVRYLVTSTFRLYGFACQIRRTGGPERIRRGRAFDRQNDEFGGLRRRIETGNTPLRILLCPIGQFHRIARAHVTS